MADIRVGDVSLATHVVDWLDPFGMAYSRLFPGHELRRVQAMVRERSGQFREAWDDFFRR